MKSGRPVPELFLKIALKDDGQSVTKNKINNSMFLFSIFPSEFEYLMIILAAVNENMKEELRIVIENQAEEMKLLRQELNSRR